MGRRRKGYAKLSEGQSLQLQKLAEANVSDAELLTALMQLAPRVWRTPQKIAELLHTEFDVPLEPALIWCVDDGLASGLQTDELADRCWRWIHARYRGAQPWQRIARLTEEHLGLVDARADEITRLVTTPVKRDRAAFERALLEAYRLADLAPPRILWVSGPGAGLLMAMLCMYHGPERKRLGELLSERRFADPPDHSLASAMDDLCVALRQFMPSIYEADLPRYLSFDLLGGDATSRIVDELLGKAVKRLDPVRKTRLSAGLVQTLRQKLAIPGAGEARSIREGVVEAMRRAVEDIDEGGLFRDFLSREPGVWWQSLLGDAAVAHTASSLGVDPVYPLARLHKLAWALATGGYWSWLGYKVAICADGPTEVGLEGVLLHGEDAPALSFKDGFDVYAVEGHVVPDWVITHPKTIKLDLINAERNAEVRRIMIDQYGRGRYLAETGAGVVDMDMVDVVAGDPDYGSMPRALMRDDQNRMWLVGTDGSTKRVYYMRVPDRTKSCSDAHEALAGMDESKIIASS